MNVGRLSLLAVGLIAVLGCTSAAPATPSPSAIASIPATASQSAASPSAVPSLAGSPAPTTTPQVIVTPIPETPAPSETPAVTPSTEPPSSAPTEPPASPTIGPPTAPPTSAPLILDWQRSANPGMGSAEDIYASAASGNRVVAVGDNSDIDPVIWTTTN